MPTINKPTLIEFENERKAISLIPPNQSNSFYSIGEGTINLLTLRNNPDDYRFDLFTNSGVINTGPGIFTISGDIIDIDNPYRDCTVIQNTTLVIDEHLIVDKGVLNIHGNLILKPNATLKIRNGGIINCYSNSSITIGNNVQIDIDNDSELKIYGEIKILQSFIEVLLNNPKIYIDSSAYFTIDTSFIHRNIPSLIDYNNELKDKSININTQSTKDYLGGRIGYVWRDGTPYNTSSVVDLRVLMGDATLGDFRLSVTGALETVGMGFHSVNNLIIENKSTLYVSEIYKENIYYNPELYIGIIIGNNLIPGKCIVRGKLIVDGSKSSIIIDRGGSLYIEENAELHLKNNAILKSTYNDLNQVLFLYGTLIIDDVNQLSSLQKENIFFGEKSKIIILNPDTGTKRILFTTPNGILDSELYRIFYDNIERVEYHISNNTGIGIDQYYEFYNREMTKWYANRRIEKAVKDGLIIWEDGGFIELNSNIIPWVNEDCTLLEASRLFKSFGSFDEEKIKDVVNRLLYAGFGNIIFKFIYNNNFHEVIFNLEKIKMITIYNNPIIKKFTMVTDNSGQLFLRNMIPNDDLETIINIKSKKFDIDDTHRITFEL